MSLVGKVAFQIVATTQIGVIGLEDCTASFCRSDKGGVGEVRGAICGKPVLVIAFPRATIEIAWRKMIYVTLPRPCAGR